MICFPGDWAFIQGCEWAGKDVTVRMGFEGKLVERCRASEGDDSLKGRDVGQG